MKIHKNVLLFGFAVLFFGCVNLRAGDDLWIMRPVEKLGRGIANVGFSPLEIFIRWMEVKNDQGGIAGITYGSLRGVCYTVARIGVGVVDILTFPFPLPDCPNYENDYGWGYGPIMRPAWVVDVGHDWNDFVYDQSSVVKPTSN